MKVNPYTLRRQLSLSAKLGFMVGWLVVLGLMAL